MNQMVHLQQQFASEIRVTACRGFSQLRFIRLSRACHNGNAAMGIRTFRRNLPGTTTGYNFMQGPRKC